MENTFKIFGKEYRLTERGIKVYKICGMITAGVIGMFFTYLVFMTFFG